MLIEREIQKKRKTDKKEEEEYYDSESDPSQEDDMFDKMGKSFTSFKKTLGVG
jgi:hypothetical protein